jgi:cytochrome c5
MLNIRFIILAALAALPLASHAGDTGRTSYQSVCIACHAPENVMVSAPKAGDVAEWRKRLDRGPHGLDTLTEHAIEGFGAMPPKGGHSELSREQIRQAIEFMMRPQDTPRQ